MKKENSLFFKSTLFLIIGGLGTRILGFIIRIIYTRIIGTEGIALYSVVMPSYSMLLTITSLAMPIALSKLVAEAKKRSIKLISNALFITLFINFLVIIIMIFSSDFIATNLLHEPRCKSLLIAMSFTFPFVSISSVIKGYFNGKQKTLPYMISNILEQVLRMIIIILVLPILYQKSTILAVKGLILLSVISEIFSIFIFMLFMPKRVTIKKEDIKINLNTEKEILGIAIPTVSGKIIGNVGYFLEPIILINLLSINGYNNTYILNEYGFYNTYAISVLTIPAFFIAALANTIIPEISKHIKNNNQKMVKRRIKQSIISTFAVGLLFSIFILLFRNNLLNLLYKTTNGSNYIKLLAPFFALFYLENILYSILQASGNAKKAMKITTFGVIIKTVSMIALCFLKIGLYSLAISEIINILFVISMNFITIKKEKLL